jgi:hypothetical protein
MAHWSWVEADNHIEFAYAEAGVAPEERLRPAVSRTAEPISSPNLEGYPYKDNILGRLAVLGEDHGTEPRVELVFEMAPIIAQNAS